MGKSKTIEKLSEDMLDSDFITAFKPILFIQHISGACGVRMECKFVTLATKLYKLYHCVAWFIQISGLITCIAYCETDYKTYSSAPLKAGISLNGLINSILASKTVFFEGRENCELFVSLQKIDRNLNLKNAKELNRGLFKTSIVWIGFAVLFLNIWVYVLCNYIFNEITPYAILTGIVCSTGYVDTPLLLAVLYFMVLRVRYINDTLRNGIRENKEQPIDEIDGLIVPDEIVKGMYSVLDTFSKVMDLFQFGLLGTTIQLLAWQLITMYNYVSCIKYDISVFNSTFLYALPVCSINMITATIECIVMQSLVTKLEESKEVSQTLKYSLKDGKSRDNAKRIILLVNAKRDANVYGLLTINNRLPLTLLAITAIYTIVLLQFAVL